jgi:hypothetical protein
VFKGCLEVIGHGVVQVLSACYGPDRQRSILAKIGITATTANQEEGTSFLEQEQPARSVQRLATLVGGCSTNAALTGGRLLCGDR